MEDLAKKFDGFDSVMTKVLDKLTALEAWKSTASASMDQLLAQSERTAHRVDTIEFIPAPVPMRPPLRPATTPPQPPPRWTNPFDLNSAPHHEMRPPASSSGRPSGHHVATNHRDVGGGILGSHLPHPVTGTSPDPNPHESGSGDDGRAFARKPVSLPKMEFPKFDGENPRLWKARCEMYFEVFGVSEHMKTRFAALNFEGPAASWLQTLELRVGVFRRGLLFAQPFVSVLIEISIRSICVNLMPCDKLAPWQITITVLSNCPIAAL